MRAPHAGAGLVAARPGAPGAALGLAASPGGVSGVVALMRDTEYERTLDDRERPADFEAQARAEIERVQRHGWGEVVLIYADGQLKEVRATTTRRADRARKG